MAAACLRHLITGKTMESVSKKRLLMERFFFVRSSGRT
jgi:hypothetical protein